MGAVVAGLTSLLGESLLTTLATTAVSAGVGALAENAMSKPDKPDLDRSSSTTVGTGAETKPTTFEGETKRETALDKKRRGTKGLQIPLQTPVATTAASGISTDTQTSGGLMI